MSNYVDLLATLITNSHVSITSSISESNLRVGLKKALADYNASQSIMEFPEEERVIRISKQKGTSADSKKGNRFNLLLIDKSAPRQGAFTFNIIESEESDDGKANS